MPHYIQRFTRDSKGATAVEFALVSTAFITFVMATAYVGIMLFTYAGVHWAVEDASRVAAINTSATQTDITTAVNAELSSVGLPSATSVSYSVASGTIPVATVSATLTQTYVVPLISTVTITYSASTKVPQGS